MTCVGYALPILPTISLPLCRPRQQLPPSLLTNARRSRSSHNCTGRQPRYVATYRKSISLVGNAIFVRFKMGAFHHVYDDRQMLWRSSMSLPQASTLHQGSLTLGLLVGFRLYFPAHSMSPAYCFTSRQTTLPRKRRRPSPAMPLLPPLPGLLLRRARLEAMPTSRTSPPGRNTLTTWRCGMLLRYTDV